MAPWKSNSLATLMAPEGGSLAGWLIRGALRAMGLLGTPGGAHVCGGCREGQGMLSVCVVPDRQKNFVMGEPEGWSRNSRPQS